jgi:hypothetical protein
MRRLHRPYSEQFNKPNIGSAHLLVALILFAILAPTRAVSNVNSTSATLALSVSADRPMYREGDPVKVQLQLKNLSGKDMSIVNSSPWFAVNLIVRDARGTPVSPREKSNANYISTHGFVLGAGKKFTLSWEGQDWSDLRNWGYGPLASGRYTIEGVPIITGQYRKPLDGFQSSNNVEITVDKK